MFAFARAFLVPLFLLQIAAGPLRAQEAAHNHESPAAAGDGHANHLITERSPYLLMHAHNPVDWYPWGEEAFQKARRENKPIFLSIGYYACHWCHVMERESFSNAEVAALLNRSFVAIKVDREERPDIDRVYMTFVEASTGKAGWPLNVVLTPNLKPFFGGIYFPPHDREGRPGLTTILTRISEAWQHKHAQIQKSADGIIEQLQAMARPHSQPGAALNASILDHGQAQIKESYDSRNGGFGAGEKFSSSSTLQYLFRDQMRAHRPASLEMALKSLRAMAAGGFQDQLGGGFHRYSTDPQWRIPHFEKMLSDQAQLAISYLQAFQITRDESYAEVARRTLDFVLREMQAPEGGFYSSLSADSPAAGDHGKAAEGAFYLWKAAEIERVLGPVSAPVFEFRFGIEDGGNVAARQDSAKTLKFENVLYQAHDLEETARKFRMSQAQAAALLSASQKQLLAVRATRPAPLRDTKLVTAGNGLMLSAFARASQLMDRKKYLAAALQLGGFMERKLFDPETGSLKHHYYRPEAEGDGLAEDYAFLVQGLLDLYETSFDPRWLQWAMRLQARQDQLFWDSANGGYFSNGSDSSVILKTRTAFETDQPSPNSVAVMNLLRLWQYSGDEALKQKADRTLSAFAAQMIAAPQACPSMLAALDFSMARQKQVVVAGDLEREDTQDMLALVWSRFMPNRTLMFVDGGRMQGELALLRPSVAVMKTQDGRATVYVCENFICKRPSNDPATVARLLDEP